MGKDKQKVKVEAEVKDKRATGLLGVATNLVDMLIWIRSTQTT